MTTLEPRDATAELPYAPDSDRWDDDDDDFPVRPVRKRLGPWSLGLIGAVIAAGAFYGGVMTEKHHIPATTTVSAAARARTATTGTTTGGTGTTGTTGAGARTGTGTGAGAGAAGGAGGAGAGSTVGTVKLIDGTNVYVQDATGTITKVATTPQSTITITSTGTTKNIKPGDTVVVSGSTGSDGIVSATAIRDVGAGGAGLGFGGGGGRGFGGGGGGGGAAATRAGGGGGGGLFLSGGGG